MSQTGSLRIAQNDAGYVLAVEGRGTLRESPAAEAFVQQLLRDDLQSTVVVDLQNCDYLDSTFLGCLITLHKQFGVAKPPRFFVAAGTDCRQKLLAPTFLDRFLNLVESAPAVMGDWTPLPTSPLESQELGRHVMECHRRLAELGSPCAKAFGQVADRLEKELTEQAGRA